MRMRLHLTILALALALAQGTCCVAQSVSVDDGIHASGEVSLARRPDVMRVHLRLIVKGSDLSEALAKYQSRREAVEQQLTKLGAIPASVQFSDLEQVTVQNNRRAQMQQMMRQRMAQSRSPKPADGQALPSEPVIVGSLLSVEWPIPPGDEIQTLLAVDALQKAIKAVELGITKEDREPSPEENELEEEMAGLDIDFNDGGNSLESEPDFFLVSRVSDEDHARGLREAYEKAHAEAVALAAASAQGLGELRSLQSTSGERNRDRRDYEDFYPSQYRSSRREQETSTSREVVGKTLGALKYQISVQTTFAIQPKAP
jgi:uncharacterized protein YggE